jgi:hypothetical protein
MHAFHWPQRSRPSRGTIVKDTAAQRRDHERRGQIINVPHHTRPDILRPSGWKTAIVLLRTSPNEVEGTSQSETLQTAQLASTELLSVPDWKRNLLQDSVDSFGEKGPLKSHKGDVP